MQLPTQPFSIHILHVYFSVVYIGDRMRLAFSSDNTPEGNGVGFHGMLYTNAPSCEENLRRKRQGRPVQSYNRIPVPVAIIGQPCRYRYTVRCVSHKVLI